MKKLKLFFLFLLFTFTFQLGSGQSWQLLPNSPAQTFRHDDLWFINANEGWVVNVNGQVWNTTDGGNTWKQLINQPSSIVS